MPRRDAIVCAALCIVPVGSLLIDPALTRVLAPLCLAGAIMYLG